MLLVYGEYLQKIFHILGSRDVLKCIKCDVIIAYVIIAYLKSIVHLTAYIIIMDTNKYILKHF